ncbi:multicopper oxidase domain-containing protein [Luteococcus sp. OSA5]|uniref:multicopper oxidase domain-containing protein n=1 Tax=Luteococcus sp. OSA5 TaxID=3401630 RepID=UPI003B4309DF
MDIVNSRERAPRPLKRRDWHTRAALPMVAWMVATILVVTLHRFIPRATWLMVHLVTLGVVSNAIVVWSNHFSDAVLRSARTDHRREGLQLVLLNVGLVLLCAGIVWQFSWPAWAGVLCVVAVCGVAVWDLGRQLRAGLTARFAGIVSWYRAAAGCLAVGAVLGGLMAVPFGRWADALLLSHLALNILGWVALTVWGTLVTLWPTMLRTRSPQGVEALAARSLPRLVMSLSAVAIAPALAPVAPRGWRIVGALALCLYLATLVEASWPSWRLWLATRRTTVPVLSVAAGQLWFLGWLLWLVWHWMAASTPAGLVAQLRNTVPVIVVGFLLQVLVGALSYLVPVVLGGGPSLVRATTAVFERGGVARLTVVNLGLAVFMLPITSLWKVTSSTAVFIALALFVERLVRAWRLRRSEPAKLSVSEPVVPRLRRGIAIGTAWTVFAAGLAAVADPVSFRAMAGLGTTAATTGGTGQTTEVTVEASGMRFTPNQIEVPAGNRLVITLVNRDEGMVHDLILESGLTTGRVEPGQTAELDAGVQQASSTGWCSVTGHRAMGMELAITVTGAQADTSQGQESPAQQGHGGHTGMGDAPASDDPAVQTPRLDLSKDYSSQWSPRDATLPPASDAKLHRHTLRVTDEVVEVAPGVKQTLWLFNGQAPGPVLRGKVGDVFEITLVNEGGMGHGIDFHAGALAPDRPMRTIAPGESLVYRFTAGRAGIWLYHCSTMPMSQHIANGMYGAVVIDPPDLPEVDREYLLVQGEQYYGAEADGAPGVADMTKLQAEKPDAVVFNGHPGQYVDHPLEAKVGERVRFWVLDAGPNRPWAFHIVGAQFDSVWFEGAWRLKQGKGPGDPTSTDGGSQTLGMLASQGGFVETVFPEAGHYSMVNHQMVDAERGASGVVRVR